MRRVQPLVILEAPLVHQVAERVTAAWENVVLNQVGPSFCSRQTNRSQAETRAGAATKRRQAVLKGLPSLGLWGG